MTMRLPLLIPGAALVVVAALVSGPAIEQALGRPVGALAWGPALFRWLLALHGRLLLVLAVRRSGRGVDATRDRLPLPWKALLILSLAAFVLRVIRLDTGLWLDEVFAHVGIFRQPFGTVVSSFTTQNQHMLYSILAHFSLRVFGESAWAIRLPGVLFGVASLWALYLLGRRTIGARGAWLACALMTVSYHHIWFSQNARGYTGLLFFALLATWLWLEAQPAGGWRWWLAYSFACFLGAWVHMTMVFVVVSHALVWLFAPKKNWKRPIGAWLLCGTMTFQVYALALPEFFSGALGETSLPSEWVSPLWLLKESFRNLRMAFAGAAVVVLGAAIAAAGWLDIFRRERATAAIMALPAILGGAMMIALGHNLWPRFFFFSMGFGLLVVVNGAVKVPRERVGLALVLLLIVASAITVPRCYALPKQDFAGARDYVERSRTSGEIVVATGLAASVYRSYYAPAWAATKTDAGFEELVRSGNLAWVVYTLPIQLRAWQPRTWEAVQRDFEVVKAFPGTLGGGEVYVCRRRPAKSAKMVAYP